MEKRVGEGAQRFSKAALCTSQQVKVCVRVSACLPPCAGSSPSRVFGAPLEDVMDVDGDSGVPSVIADAMAHIRQHGVYMRVFGGGDHFVLRLCGGPLG